MVGGSVMHHGDAEYEDVDDEMDSDYSTKECGEYGCRRAPFNSALCADRNNAYSGAYEIAQRSSEIHVHVSSASDDHDSYERGAFSPVFEDESPGRTSGAEADSSPIGPITPFSNFVVRAVAAAPSRATFYESSHSHAASEYCLRKDNCHLCCGAPSYQASVDYNYKAPFDITVKEAFVSPIATFSYRKLVDPLSHWVSHYVWKVCTSGLDLPPAFGRISQNHSSFPDSPPSDLSSLVHSLLLSTLLQPSAILLALWYIARLPVYFNAVSMGPEFLKEVNFRAELFGNRVPGHDKNTEDSAPFRLIVVGLMLANKWLDDHTFSNKTWHTISKVPLNSLNKLETLALEIFRYDLNISTRDWSLWLMHISSFHGTSSPSYPQPISRPSANPRSIIRNAIDEILQAPAACKNKYYSQPIFLGLAERLRDRHEKEQIMEGDVLDIDLDEDGPLREEYLPKRRIGAPSNNHITRIRALEAATIVNKEAVCNWNNGLLSSLPPPAKWSPAGDEPLLRHVNRTSGHYLPVQPPAHHIAFHPSWEMSYEQAWNSSDKSLNIKQPTYMFGLPPMHLPHMPMYGAFACPPHLPMYHSRSQSLEKGQLHFNPNSFLDLDLQHRSRDLPSANNRIAPQDCLDSRWNGSAAHQYSSSNFSALPGIGFQPVWLRI